MAISRSEANRRYWETITNRDYWLIASVRFRREHPNRDFELFQNNWNEALAREPEERYREAVLKTLVP